MALSKVARPTSLAAQALRNSSAITEFTDMTRSLVTTIHRQLLPTLEMLNRVVKQCPPELWVVEGPTASIRNRVVHAAESVDYWIGDPTTYRYRELDPRPQRPQLTDELPDTLTQGNVQAYVSAVAMKAIGELLKLDDTTILKAHPRTGMPMLSAFLGQVRHVQLNVGYCNEKLVANGAPSVAWIGSSDLPDDFTVA